MLFFILESPITLKVAVFRGFSYHKHCLCVNYKKAFIPSKLLNCKKMSPVTLSAEHFCAVYRLYNLIWPPCLSDNFKNDYLLSVKIFLSHRDDKSSTFICCFSQLDFKLLRVRTIVILLFTPLCSVQSQLVLRPQCPANEVTQQVLCQFSALKEASKTLAGKI